MNTLEMFGGTLRRDDKYESSISHEDQALPGLQLTCRDTDDGETDRASTVKIVEVKTAPPAFDGGSFRAEVIGRR